MNEVAIGIDIGGTFTDVVMRDENGKTRLAKIPSTRADPSVAVKHVLESLGSTWGVSAEAVKHFVHGTTVATNAVLERKGAKVGMLATEGFTDVLEIGRQNRQELYDLVIRQQTPVFLCPGALRRGVAERIGPDGKVQKPLDPASLEKAVESLVAQGVESIAVCFLFSFVNPAHERLAADFIRRRHPSIMVSLSSDVDPAFREYERSCVTAFDAYVKPVLDRYLQSMESALDSVGIGSPLQIMQSRGGTCSSAIARKRPVRLFLSGPAAGVIGANEVGASVSMDNLITVDIGGTSSDIALIMGSNPLIRANGYVDTYNIRVPMIDVNAVGAGGGSIAWIDGAGGLRVGPQSAGADPGPACYGRGGTEATVTDASVVLGLLNPSYFAGGTLTLDPALAFAAIEKRVARPLGISVEDAALGVHRVANVQMAEGIRLVSVKRGIDPRGFALVPFGGAGPLHATALADELGMKTILVPRNPGVLSAAGLLAAKIEHEASVTFMCSLDGADLLALKAAYAKLESSCAALLKAENVLAHTTRTNYFADICYIGQAHYVEVPISIDAPDLAARAYDQFCKLYEQHYGHHTRSPARIVNLRVVQQAQRIAQPPQPPRRAAAQTSSKGVRRMLTARTGSYVDATLYDRETIGTDTAIAGPAIIEQADTTIVIEPGWSASPAQHDVLILRRTA
jgi:N-methylhydantoinase A